MSPSPALTAHDITKSYGGTTVLTGVDLSVEAGSVFGFLGANGSGKTTFIRMVLALAAPTSGEIRLLGHPAGSPQVRSQIGYCPDVPGFPTWMSAREVLEQAAVLFGLSGTTTRRRVPELLELVGLDDTRAKVSGYSRGMRQRLGLAQALINAPQLLILDEPTSALDPIGRRLVLDLLEQLRGKTTVFFSTHLLPDVERVCDHVAIIDAGRIAATGTLNDVRTSLGTAQHRLIVETSNGTALRAYLDQQPWVLETALALTASSLHGDALEVVVPDLLEGAARVADAVAVNGLRLYRLEPRDTSLEDVFVNLSKETR